MHPNSFVTLLAHYVSPDPPLPYPDPGVFLPSPWLSGAILLCVLFALPMFHRRMLARHRFDRCVSCGYDLSGINGVCPECGKGRGVNVTD